MTERQKEDKFRQFGISLRQKPDWRFQLNRNKVGILLFSNSFGMELRSIGFGYWTIKYVPQKSFYITVITIRTLYNGNVEKTFNRFISRGKDIRITRF